MSKTNHGPCMVCGRPILYLGCLFCGPACNFSLLADRAKESMSRAAVAPPPPPPPPSAVVPPPSPPAAEPPPPSPGGFMSIQPAPDEPSGRAR